MTEMRRRRRDRELDGFVDIELKGIVVAPCDKAPYQSSVHLCKKQSLCEDGMLPTGNYSLESNVNIVITSILYYILYTLLFITSFLKS